MAVRHDRQVIKMLVIVVTLFALCWMPLQTYYLMQTYFPIINEYKYINIMFFCFDWLAMSNSCYNPFIYGIYNEKFKREFKQRFPFCRSHKGKSLADSIDIDKNPSFQTRLSSFRSTCDSRRHSTRLSLAITQPQAQPAYRKSMRTGMFCYKNGIDAGPGDFTTSKRPDTKPPDLNEEEEGSFRFNNGARPRCKLLMSDLDAIFDSRKVESIESASPEDERVTELYIFPNSNIIELKDNIQERKL